MGGLLRKTTHLRVAVVFLLLCIFNASSLEDSTAEKKADLRSGRHFDVKFTLDVGDVTVRVYDDWSPDGVDRFRELVNTGHFIDCKFFRAIRNFITQFGIASEPEDYWTKQRMEDEPVVVGNNRGTLAFAAAGKNGRTCQLYFNLKDNNYLDDMGFGSIGEVIEGMDIVDSIYTGYGQQPQQFKIRQEGNKYLEREFPELTTIHFVSIVKDYEDDFSYFEYDYSEHDEL